MFTYVASKFFDLRKTYFGNKEINIGTQKGAEKTLFNLPENDSSTYDKFENTFNT